MDTMEKRKNLSVRELISGRPVFSLFIWLGHRHSPISDLWNLTEKKKEVILILISWPYFAFRQRKHGEMKVAEEYCWVITQAVEP